MIMNKPLSTGKSLIDLLTGIELASDVADIEILSVTSNSRDVTQGALFIALKGAQTHGIDYALDAANAGATAILFDSFDDYSQQRSTLLQKQTDVLCLGVGDLYRLNGQIVSRFYGDPSRYFKLIGVTGTDGKTSVTNLMSQALTRLGQRVGSIGTIGYGVGNQLKATQHTTPDVATLQSYLYEFNRQQCDVVVMEVSSHCA